MAYLSKRKGSAFIYWGCTACEDCFYLDKPERVNYCPHCGEKIENPNGEPCPLDVDYREQDEKS